MYCVGILHNSETLNPMVHKEIIGPCGVVASRTDFGIFGHSTLLIASSNKTQKKSLETEGYSQEFLLYKKKKKLRVKIFTL